MITTKNISLYDHHKRIAVLTKPSAPSILVCTEDSDRWLIDVVKYYPSSGDVTDSFGINANQLQESIIHWQAKGYAGIVRSNINDTPDEGHKRRNEQWQ